MKNSRFKFVAASLVSALVFACNGEEGSGVGASENTAAACQDSVDNDGDGLIDCVDQECWAFVFCQDGDLDGGVDSGGEVGFYTKQPLVDGPITVWVNGVVVGAITSYFETFTCNQPGGATLKTAPGVYDYNAQSAGGNLTWSGAVTVSSGQCLRFNLYYDEQDTDSGLDIDGEAGFYTEQPLLDGNISVQVEGVQVGIITAAFAAFDCNQPGGVTVKRAPGNYAYAAQSAGGLLEWSGTVAVLAEQCVKHKLSYDDVDTDTDPDTEGEVGFYTKQPLIDGDITVQLEGVDVGVITSTFDTFDCNQPGGVTVRRPPGSYDYAAHSAGEQINWSGTVEVKPGVCFKLDLYYDEDTDTDGTPFGEHGGAAH